MSACVLNRSDWSPLSGDILTEVCMVELNRPADESTLQGVGVVGYLSGDMSGNKRSLRLRRCGDIDSG